MEIHDQTLGGLRPVSATCASGRLELGCSMSPTALFVVAFYLSSLGRLKLTLLAICIDIATL